MNCNFPESRKPMYLKGIRRDSQRDSEGLNSGEEAIEWGCFSLNPHHDIAIVRRIPGLQTKERPIRPSLGSAHGKGRGNGGKGIREVTCKICGKTVKIECYAHTQTCSRECKNESLRRLAIKWRDAKRNDAGKKKEKEYEAA